MLESAIERWLRSKVREAGGLYYKFVSPGQTGVPDRIVIYEGVVHFVELKQSDGRLAEIQKVQLRRLWEHGMYVHVVYGKTGAESFFNGLIAGMPGIAPVTLHVWR